MVGGIIEAGLTVVKFMDTGIIKLVYKLISIMTEKIQDTIAIQLTGQIFLI
jgi:hypothetical protein